MRLQRAIVKSRQASVRRMYPHAIPNPPLTIIDDLLPCLATAAKQCSKGKGVGKKVGRAAANRMMGLQAALGAEFLDLGKMENRREGNPIFSRLKQNL